MALLAATVTALTPPAAADDTKAPRATLAAFARHWYGHTRRLTITRSGYARERIDDGCCYRVIDLAFTLSRPRGTTNDARVTFRVTGVKL